MDIKASRAPARRESYRRAFDNLRQAFLEEVPDKIGAIRRAAEKVGGGSGDATETLQHLVHRLVGSAEIFGLSRLSGAARVLEERVNALLESEGFDPALRRQLVDLVSEMERAWSQEPRP
jgi:HPt (histidine-containing phosphotransfer) domain-containing protein